jgi:DNA-binding MarR family transcriptional regulator
MNGHKPSRTEILILLTLARRSTPAADLARDVSTRAKSTTAAVYKALDSLRASGAVERCSSAHGAPWRLTDYGSRIIATDAVVAACMAINMERHGGITNGNTKTPR